MSLDFKLVTVVTVDFNYVDILIIDHLILGTFDFMFHVKGAILVCNLYQFMQLFI